MKKIPWSDKDYDKDDFLKRFDCDFEIYSQFTKNMRKCGRIATVKVRDGRKTKYLCHEHAKIRGII